MLRDNSDCVTVSAAVSYLRQVSSELLETGGSEGVEVLVHEHEVDERVVQNDRSLAADESFEQLAR